MRIRVISDLHLDLNDRHGGKEFVLKDKDTFTILCGDTSGNPEITTKWIRENVRHGVFVAGNHLVYNDLGKGIDELREMMYEADTGDCQYLDCLVQGCPIFREIGENIVVLGSTMYTDFKLETHCHEKLSPDMVVTRNKYLSEKCMNDYNWGQVRVNAEKYRKLSANDLEAGFNSFFGRLKIAVEEIFPDKDIIVATHYCPSPRCISEEYVDDDANASYVSDLEDFIKSHGNIKLWACGHVHHRGNFKVGDCRIVMNPRGYIHRAEDVQFDQNMYIDTSDWKVRWHRKSKEEIDEIAERREKYLRALRWFC